MQRSLKLLTVSAGLVLAMSSAMAQTTPANNSGATTPVGVTPSTAAEANRKAVPNNNVGTVVRTSPTAVDKAQAAMPDSTTTATPAATTDMTTAPRTKRMRPARADRN